MLQETLNLPPVDSEAVNRLVLERFVDPLGWCKGYRLEELPGKGVLTLPGFVGVGGPCGPEGCGPPALGDSQDLAGKQL